MGGISAVSSGRPSPLYKPIDSANYEIRLLQITFSMLQTLGQGDPEPLTARLIHHTLPTAATTFSKQLLKAVGRKHYTALSYVWGDPSLTEEIIVDGHHIPITYSLYSALRQLQCDAFGEETVWVDALCINQADDAEKSAQIRNMREVYHNAGNVRVWLGSAKGENDQVYETMQYIQTLTNAFLPDKYPDSYEWWEANILPLALRPVGLTAQATLSGWHKINMFKETFRSPEIRGKSTLQALGKIDESKYFKEFLDFRPKEKHLKRFLKLVPGGDLKPVVDAIEKYLIVDPEWFNRIWVVQEVGVAWEDIDVCCGPYNINWDYLLTTIFYLHFTCGARFPSIDKVLSLEVIRLGFREGKRKSLRELMHECRYRHASDPRDKIYGLYGLMNDTVDAFLKPDYAKSVEEVFSHTTMHFIHQARSLDPICRQQTTHRRTGLSSWVPDFELDLGEAPQSLLPLDFVEKPFHASGHDERSIYDIPDPAVSLIEYATLPIRGIRIGHISILSDQTNFTDGIDSTERKWRLTLNEHIQKSDLADRENVSLALDAIASQFESYVSYQATESFGHKDGNSTSTSTLPTESTVTLVSPSPSPASSTTTVAQSHSTGSGTPIHPLIASYINVLLTGRANTTTRLTTPQLPTRPQVVSPSYSRSASSSLSNLPLATSSRSTLSFQIDQTLHKAFAGSKAPSKSSASLASSTTNATSSTTSTSNSPHAASSKDLDEFSQKLSHLESSMRRKRFFVTSEGNLGSAGEDVREGDEVFVLFGCSVPVVLRQVRKAGPGNGEERSHQEKSEFRENQMRGDREQEWEFVSEAFVDGFMDGEVLAWLARGRWERGVEDFVLV